MKQKHWIFISVALIIAIIVGGIVLAFRQRGTPQGSCFIATAAYGSYLDPHVEILREFRDQYLVTNPVGERLVSLYYKYSPPAADFIAKHDSLRAVVRVGLLPLVGISAFFVKTTLLQKLVTVTLLLLSFTAVMMWRRRRRKRIWLT